MNYPFNSNSLWAVLREANELGLMGKRIKTVTEWNFLGRDRVTFTCENDYKHTIGIPLVIFADWEKT